MLYLNIDLKLQNEMKFIAKSNQFYICDERYIEGLNIESTLYQNHNLSKTDPISYNITIP